MSRSPNEPSVLQPRGPDVDRRAHPRLTVSEVPSITAVRLKYGPAVTLIDLASGGAQIEATNLGLQPGAMVTIEITGQTGRTAIPAVVRRCQLASLQPQLVYRVTLVFNRPIDLKDLGFDLKPRTDGLNPAVEAARLEQLLTRLHADLAGRVTSAGVQTSAVFAALDAALSILGSPAGQRAGPPLAHALASLLKATTDFLMLAPTSTALIAAVEEELRQAVPARTIRDATSFLQLPGSEAVLFTIPALDRSTPVRQLAIEFAAGCEPLELHFQLLKAGVQLIAIAEELGRLNGTECPLATFPQPDASRRADAMVY
jgi:hypothetical protein